MECPIYAKVRMNVQPLLISKLGFLTSNLIFLSTCMNLGGQDVFFFFQMDSLSLKRKRGLEEGGGRSRIFIVVVLE